MAKKHSKQQANYRQATTHDKRCAFCTHFRHSYEHKPASCAVVAGAIDSRMVSDYFRRR